MLGEKLFLFNFLSFPMSKIKSPSQYYISIKFLKNKFFKEILQNSIRLIRDQSACFSHVFKNKSLIGDLDVGNSAIENSWRNLKFCFQSNLLSQYRVILFFPFKISFIIKLIGLWENKMNYLVLINYFPAKNLVFQSNKLNTQNIKTQVPSLSPISLSNPLSFSSILSSYLSKKKSSTK